jgi:hypothetical protein
MDRASDRWDIWMHNLRSSGTGDVTHPPPVLVGRRFSWAVWERMEPDRSGRAFWGAFASGGTLRGNRDRTVGARNEARE